MQKTKLLIFPLDIDHADAFIEVAKALGIEILGASSAMASQGDRQVDGFIRLPFVTDSEFDAALLLELERHAVTTIYAPHQGVWRHLDALRRTKPTLFRFNLCEPDPFSAARLRFAQHEKWADSASSDPGFAGLIEAEAIHPALSSAFYAALHRQFLSIPGDSDLGKLDALCNIARLLPAGDFVEVGSLYGRSAFALGCLADRYKLGSLVCVDPWNFAAVTDQGPGAALLNADYTRMDIDLEKVFRIFLGAVAMVKNVGYIRKTSEAAASDYRLAVDCGELHSPELGCIPLAGHLSLLHIDGNHRYDHVQRDVELWSPYLVKGGWLLLDDYVWAFGDGPRRVGDALLGSTLYDSAFVSGDTLFMRRTAVPG